MDVASMRNLKSDGDLSTKNLTQTTMQTHN